MKKLLPLAFLFLSFSLSYCQGPEVTSWIINVDGETGYDNILSNCSSVQYSDDWVYVSCTGIPDYDIGPWPGNPNTAQDQGWVFRITRDPQENSGVLIATPLGHIGVWTNGVTIFNAKDAMSYQNEATWNQNAIVVEGPSFDDCLGHPQQQGEYHMHLNPTCLYDDANSSVHSPVIGYAFDGFPIYGAYGYANPDGSGGIARMRPSYQLRNITARESLPDGTSLASNLYGPTIGAQYPLGYYIEDYEFVDGLGDLDEHNGRWCITPEYPQGSYAYFVTIDENQEAIYPYTLGLSYYGTVPAGNTGMTGGHNVISETVQTYTPTFVTEKSGHEFGLFPNPADDHTSVSVPETGDNIFSLEIIDMTGSVVYSRKNTIITSQFYLDISQLSAGMYVLSLRSAEWTAFRKLEVK